MRLGVFFDRDGTLIEDRHYLSDPHQIQLKDGAIELLQWLRMEGFQTALITNQSGVARGYFELVAQTILHEHLQAKLQHTFDFIGICPHHPQGIVAQYRAVCDCRKPRPGLFFQALEKLNLQPKHCFAIGDKPRDLLAAKRAGITNLYLLGPNSGAYPTLESLHQFLMIIQNSAKSPAMSQPTP